MNSNPPQLNSAESFDVNKIIFSKPQDGSIPDSKPAITYKRINISTLNDDGSVGELIVPTERLYSYGVSENTNMDTGKVNGYVLPLVLHDKNGVTNEQKAFVETFNNIVEKCKEYLLENKEESKGKKLSFIIQEIGREINTTGSKAYDADIQKCVVTMKDELEKAKEQILNVL